MLWAAACAPRQTSISYEKDSGIRSSDKKLHLTIEHNANGAEWQLSYKFDRPIQAFAFMTDFSERRSTWKVGESDQVNWGSSGQGDVLVGKDGKLFDSFSLKFQTKVIEQDNEPVILFSDNSKALFTSAVNGFELLQSDSKWSAFQFHPYFTLVPGAGESVTIGGETKNTKLDFQESPRSMGSYIYFGSIQPQVINKIPFLIDPAIGKEVVDLAVAAESQAVSLLKSQLGELPFIPTILMRHIPDHPSINSASGVAFWGSFLINIAGAGTDLKVEEREAITNAVIHETVHFWNALLYQARWLDADKKRLVADMPESTYDAWIWEGGAQALSLDTQLTLKLTDASRYAQIQAGLLKKCKDVIGNKRVIDARSDAALTWAAYHCGEFLQFLIVGIAAKNRPGYNIVALWKDIFAKSPDKQLDNDVFFSAVKNAIPAISDAKIGAMKSFLVSPADKLDDIVLKINAL